MRLVGTALPIRPFAPDTSRMKLSYRMRRCHRQGNPLSLHTHLRVSCSTGHLVRRLAISTRGRCVQMRNRSNFGTPLRRRRTGWRTPSCHRQTAPPRTRTNKAHCLHNACPLGKGEDSGKRPPRRPNSSLPPGTPGHSRLRSDIGATMAGRKNRSSGSRPASTLPPPPRTRRGPTARYSRSWDSQVQPEQPPRTNPGSPHQGFPNQHSQKTSRRPQTPTYSRRISSFAPPSL